MDTITPESIVNEFDNEVKVMNLIAEKVGGEFDGDVFTFDTFSLLRFADFLVQTTLDNYEEIQNSPDL